MSFFSTPVFHQYLIGVLFISTGLLHFIKPRAYLKIMPKYLPKPKALVFWSGVFEVLGGIGFIIPSLRIAAAYGLIALLIAVFPANIEMLIRVYYKKGLSTIYTWLLILRLPLQFWIIYWVYWAGILAP